MLLSATFSYLFSSSTLTVLRVPSETGLIFTFFRGTFLVLTAPDRRSDDAMWKEASEAGFNFVLSEQSGKYGMYVEQAIKKLNPQLI